MRVVRGLTNGMRPRVFDIDVEIRMLRSTNAMLLKRKILKTDSSTVFKNKTIAIHVDFVAGRRK